MKSLGPTVELVLTLPKLAPRPADSNKGMFGRVLVVSGSRGMSGAAILCGSATLRSGAGLVCVAVAEGILPIVAAGNACYMTAPLPEDAAGRLAAGALEPLRQLIASNDVVALGPGLGRSDELVRLVTGIVRESKVPVVLDADGLNAFEGKAQLLKQRNAPAILTPHPGEFARLLGIETSEVQARRSDLALQFAAEHRVVLLLKGAGTIVTDGRRFYQNTTGNAGMATGGTGDVLTGVIAALVGQGLEPFAAAQLGSYLHGLAGDMARDKRGEVSLIASDLLEWLSEAFQNRSSS
jgi:NAD(P)H-hydrate epimerase